jgi:hypothetical protein
MRVKSQESGVRSWGIASEASVFTHDSYLLTLLTREEGAKEND